MTAWSSDKMLEPPVVRCDECSQRCVFGAEAWFCTHADRLVQYVRRTAARYGLSEAEIDSEGLVQETFAELWLRLAWVESPASWLYTVAKRKAGSACRQPRRATGPVNDYLDDSGRGIPWTSLARSADSDDMLAARAALQAIAELPDKQRVATYLSCVAGWSHAEIADLLQCSVSTVGVHVHRGKKAVASSSPTRYHIGPITAENVHFGNGHSGNYSYIVENHGASDDRPWVWMWCSCRGWDRPERRSLCFCPGRMVWVTIEPDQEGPRDYSGTVMLVTARQIDQMRRLDG